MFGWLFRYLFSLDSFTCSACHCNGICIVDRVLMYVDETGCTVLITL